MKITEVMKREVVTIPLNATLGEAVSTFDKNHVSLLPVVDEERSLVGVISLRDVLRLCWPSFVNLIEDYDFVHDFGALEKIEISDALSGTPVSQIMQEPTHVDGDCGLLRAAAVMRQHDIRDLPVVDQAGRLVGLASWTDVGTAFLRNRVRREAT